MKLSRASTRRTPITDEGAFVIKYSNTGVSIAITDVNAPTKIPHYVRWFIELSRSQARHALFTKCHQKLSFHIKLENLMPANISDPYGIFSVDIQSMRNQEKVCPKLFQHCSCFWI